MFVLMNVFDEPEEPRIVRDTKAQKIRAIALAFLLPLLVLIILHRLMGPFTYYSDPIRMRLVDEHTQKPIAGAVAVAFWVQEGINQELLHKVEAASDASGTLVIPAMSRKLRGPLSQLQWRDPWIVIYKPGYGARLLHNADAYIKVYSPVGVGSYTRQLPDGRIATTGQYSNSSRRFCYWHGKTVPLVPLQRPEDETKAWEWVRGEVDDLDPQKFPRIWNSLVIGYDRLPSEVAPKNHGDPRILMRTWRPK